MRMRRIHALALCAILGACDRLADDSSTGELIARLSGALVGPMPDPHFNMAVLWRSPRGYLPGGDSCAVWESATRTEQIIQPVNSLHTINGRFFEADLYAPPPPDAFSLGRDDDFFRDPEHPERSIPFDHATGVLVAYADRNGNFRLDPCSDANCADQILGTSAAGQQFLPLPLPYDTAAWIELGRNELTALSNMYPESASSLLFTTEPWKPYGAQEIPAGYVVQRDKADTTRGQRFLDGFAPDMNIEIPLSRSPLLDGLTCDGGCVGSFVHGEAECPDLETGWCTLAPEKPPADAEFRGVQCRWFMQDNGEIEDVCNPVWSKVTWGCDRFAELWLGCPVPGPDSAPDLTWSCLE